MVLPGQGGGDRNSESGQLGFIDHEQRSPIVLSLVVILLLFSVTNLAAQEKKLDSFTISYASVSGTRAPLWIAKDLGLCTV
jgi:hypothetical protein